MNASLTLYRLLKLPFNFFANTVQSAHSASPLLWRCRERPHTGAIKTIFLLLLTCTGIFAHAQVKNDLKRQKLKGNVKSVTEYEYSAVPDAKEALKDGLRMKSICKYNADGNRTEFTTYSADGKLQSRSVYNYNDSGILVDVKRYRGDGGLNVTTTYTYDKLGNESEEHNYDPSGAMFMAGKGRYDLNGNRITYDRYDMTGHLFLKSNLRYDRNGNETEEREYDSHESLQFTTTFEYDNYDKQGNWLWKATYKNDVPRTVVEREIEY